MNGLIVLEPESKTEALHALESPKIEWMFKNINQNFQGGKSFLIETTK